MKRDSLIRHLAYRRGLITTADETFAECVRLTSGPVDRDPQTRRHWQRAAKLYVHAAELYRSGGLGLRAIAALRAAASCYESLAMHDDCEKCRRKAATIPVYDAGEPT